MKKSAQYSKNGSDREWLLVALLRLGGALTFSAFFAMFLPVSWMAATHGWLGLGDFPETPLVDYLSRSISGMYAFHGAILLGLATDIRRFLPLIRLVGWATMAFGVALLWIDLNAGMPLWWTVAEGPTVAGIGCLILWVSSGITEEKT